MAWAGRVNLSCWQLRWAQAIFKPGWDNGGLIACPLQIARDEDVRVAILVNAGDHIDEVV